MNLKMASNKYTGYMTNLRRWSANVPGVYRSPNEIDQAASDTGGIVSEVGPPKPIKTWFGPVGGYVLRPSRYNKRTYIHHGFGQAHLGEMWAAPRWQTFNLPAAGSRIVLSPELCLEQRTVMDLYQGYTANCTWILRADMVLGASFQLRVFAPEVNASATTRGVVWKPGAVESLPLYVGWSSPVPRFHKAAAKNIKGHPGLDIVVECVQNNSNEDVSEPFKLHAMCWVHDVHCYSALGSGTFDKVPTFQLQPVNPPASILEEPIMGFLQADAPEPGNPAAIAETGEPGIESAPPTQEPGPAETIATAKDPAPSREMKPAKAKPQTKAQNQKWFKWMDVQLNKDNLGTFKTFTWTPSLAAGRGDSPAVPFRRNVFCAGGWKDGLCTGMEVKVTSYRSPAVAATIAFHSSDVDGRSYVSYHTLGGSPTIVRLQPRAYVDATQLSTKQNLMVSPWIRSSQASFGMGMYCPFINTSQTIKDPYLTLFIRPGNTRFDTIHKPKPPPKAVISEEVLLAKKLEELTMSDLSTIGAIVGCLQADDPDIVEDEQGADSTGVTGPIGLEEPYEGLADSQGDEDELVQDDMWVRIADFALPIDGTVKAVTLPLWSLKDDSGFSGAISTIMEKFDRHMEIEPTEGGIYGPTIGHYQIKVRPPADTTFDVCHVCLPPEMNDETALRWFGLDDLLSMGGNLLQSVGGSLLSGAINTVGNLVGGALDSFLGGKTGSTGAEEEHAPGLVGDIPLSRYVEFIRSLDGSAGSLDYFPTVAAQVKNFMSQNNLPRADATTIPASLYVRMCKGVGTRRNVYDRTVSFDPVSPSLSLPVDDKTFGSFLMYVGRSDHPKAQRLAMQCLRVLANREFPYDLITLEKESLPTADDLSRVLGSVKRILNYRDA